jgi:hypothetical protein
LFLVLDHRDYYRKIEANTRPWNFYANRWLVFSEHQYDEENQLEKTIDTSIDLINEEVRQFQLVKSLYTPQELKTLLRQAGFQKIEMKGDWDGNELQDLSSMIIILAEKPNHKRKKDFQK